MGTTAEKLTYLNKTKTQLKDMLNLGGASLTTEPFRQYVDTLKNRYLYYINNGTQEVWDNWEKVVGEGTTITLNNTEEAPMKIVLKGNTSQEGTPTPEAPQDIHVVSGDNSINVCGKNLFDKDNVNSLVAYIDGSGKIASTAGNYLIWMKVTQNTNYAFKMTQIALSTSSYVDDVQIGLYQNTPVLNATGTRVYSQARSSATEDYTYTTTFNSGTNNYVAIKIANTSRTDTTQTLATLQLEVGTSSTPYEEYKGASYPINLGDIELCKIGDYQDSIVKDNGKWYLNKQIGKVVLDGEDTGIKVISSWDTTSLSGSYQASFSYLLTKATSTEYVILSNYFEKALLSDRNTKTNIIYTYSDGVLRIATNTSTTKADFLTWLSTHNTEVYYVLATPTYTEITDSTLISQLETLLKARSYLGQTNITQTNNDLPFIINATALREMS